MLTRKKFIAQTALATTLLLTKRTALNAFSGLENTPYSTALTILHTNDVHSRLDPFPMDGTKYQGMGGVEPRYQIINTVRAKEENILLVDSGDIVQGTPYYNFYKGKPEIEIMSMMGYEAATIGNHDFDNGIEGLLYQLQFATFPFVNCNYNFTNTPLENKIVPYIILRKKNLRIGILGVGIELQGLVPDHLFGNIIYTDPIAAANNTAYLLKKQKRCDYILCLSHLGFEYKDNKISDKILATESEYINLILGGHTHTFLDTPVEVKNKNGNAVLINQVGWAGINLGRINIYFDNNSYYTHSKQNTVINIKETSR